MKINTKELYFTTPEAFKLTVSDKEKWNGGERSRSAKSNLKSRGLNEELSFDTYREILELNGWEMVEAPRHALFRKKEMRLWNVFEDGVLLDQVKAETKEEAMNLAATSKYGDQKTTDFKGRVKTLAELAVCDMTAKEEE